MFRLYVDEVGTDDIVNVDEDNHRYLSLTGIAMEVSHSRDELEPKFNWMKAEIFDHDPDEPLIFHRRKIMNRKGSFKVLNDPIIRQRFDKALLRTIEVCEYAVITALIDKRAMLRKDQWNNKHPYHYLMEVLVEKYAQFLERKGGIGDIMPEGRMNPKDSQLQTAFEAIRENGTYFVGSKRIKARIPSHHLKFRYKPQNIAGLQFADLLAHPSHMTIREQMGHDVTIGKFCAQVRTHLMDQKYDRSNTGKVLGFGRKWLP